MSMIRVPLQPMPRKLKGTFGLGSGPVERIKRLQMLVTALIRHERIEGRFDRMDEARGYVEQLINIAIRHGDQHKPTMEIADHWLLEKDLVHKLFKVLVPRYQKSSSCYTSMFRLPNKYDLNTSNAEYLPFPAAKPTFLHNSTILELKGWIYIFHTICHLALRDRGHKKGNPYPPVLPVQRDTSGLLVNVLVAAAKEEYHKNKSSLKATTRIQGTKAPWW